MSQHDDKNNETGEIAVKGIDRREFMKRAAVGVGAVATTMVVGGCGSDNSSSPRSLAASVGPNSTTNKTAWKFGVMADTQWLNMKWADGNSYYDDGKNPNTSAIDIVQKLNDRFIAHGVNFVVQVGDFADAGYDAPGNNRNIAKADGTAAYVMANGQVAEDTRALFAQKLYNAGIGFFPVRGNHDDTAVTAQEFQTIFPQTQDGSMNASPANVLSLINPDSAKQPSPSKTGSSFTMGKNFSTIGSPSANLKGLSYGFDYNNARFVLIDQFTTLDGKDPDGAAYALGTTARKQTAWVNTTLSGRDASITPHAFVFAHKGLITQQHVDVLFGTDPSTANAPGMDDFIRVLDTNKVDFYFCGHDHIHNRSIVKTIDGNGSGQVHHILCQSNSSKFYTPNENNPTGRGAAGPSALKSNDEYFCGNKRQTQLSQELYTVGYYIVTVDGPNVQIDYYSAPIPVIYGDNTESLMLTTPATLNFTKRETFGLSKAGKEFVLSNGDPLTAVTDTYKATTIKILAGTNGNPIVDPSGRKYSNAVTTSWWDANGTASDILALWGMAYTLGSDQTDQYVLQLSYDKSKGTPVLATPDYNGTWVNAVDQNIGSNAKKLVSGPYTAGAALGTYGVDTTNGVVWAVLNYNGYFAAITGI
ncbi:metallophosphoesterase [Geobacter sp. SVR]|uniref:metallophosphoesterase family protein n=1 Tax=Geobacter sp. SVR TaxID=2495594 RepID=UPI00143F0271|nr:metallophosphoesterase [Geobacter sp. SVR]BCS55931.1 metallophosphoesterase [Geobacter sp. SVR]GCF84694.1 metallophosphoesterase [Geobacter sp. SVR]